MSGSPFLEALWRVQEREGLTARALALRIGVSEAAISRYRSGQRSPTGLVIRRTIQVWPELLGYLMVPDREQEAQEAVAGHRRV